MSCPSFLYRLSVHLAARTAPFAARLDKKLARARDAARRAARVVFGAAPAR